jgi:hypothetical protein
MSTNIELDPELRSQINSLFEKSFIDLNNKVSKLVSKHYAKVIRDLTKSNSSKNIITAPKHTRQSSSVVIPASKSSSGMKRGAPVHKAASSVEYSDDEDDSSEYSE